jgi:UDP-N-acetylglucosamine 2-epimerase (non-hydrolysing)
MINLVAGTRPNFMKIAPIWRALKRRQLRIRLVHTGQHADAAMSDVFFHDLELPRPDVLLHVAGGSHAEQTAAALVGIEADLLAHPPSVVVVAGDVTSTLAAALAAAKLGIAVAHVEAGLRARDWTMPEEINRVLTDQLSDLLLTPSRDAEPNLLAEGIPKERIVFVGNVMIDSLLRALPRAEATGASRRLGADGSHVVVTLHRPSNVDDETRLRAIAGALAAIGETRSVYFPSHPRTRARIAAFGLPMGRVALIDPLPYFDMVDVMRGAHAVITDSGGIQEETTALGVPCFTVRDNTERPITITEGTNQLVRDPARLPELVAAAQRTGTVRRPEGWDGHAGERIIEALRTK